MSHTPDLTTLAAQVEALTAAYERTQAELTAIRSQNEARRARVDGPVFADTPAAEPHPRTEPRGEAGTPSRAAGGMDRRRLLRDGLIAGAATAATVAAGSPVAAADLDPVFIGKINSGVNETFLNGSAFRVANGSITEGSGGAAAITGHAGGGSTGSSYGVVAQAEADASVARTPPARSGSRSLRTSPTCASGPGSPARPASPPSSTRWPTGPATSCGPAPASSGGAPPTARPGSG